MNRIITYRYLLGGTIFFLSFLVKAQAPIGNEVPAIKVMGTATKDAIMLRWAPNTPLGWKHANTFGYIIERTTIAVGDEIVQQPTVKKLTQTPILPKPMMDWENFVNKNDNAAIAAQAIYGEDFTVEMQETGNDMMNIVNQANVLEQRFSFALFAADQDYEVATYAGLAYVDTDINPKERYLYKIYTAIPSEKMEVKFGGVYLGLSDYRPLPEPQDFVGIFGDKSVLLSWNSTLLQKQYTNYVIERSEDQGNTYKTVSDTPVVSLNESKKKTSDRMFYIDSIPQNNKEYQYRVKGISPFGEVGPVSKIVKGEGKKALQYNPAITDAQITEDQRTAVIKWEFPEEGLESVAYFEVNKSYEINSNYQVVASNISKNERNIEVKNLDAINYFTISAVGVDGTKRTSFPKMIQPADHTPPAAPIGLKGVIDSTGVIQLNWTANIEKDFLGYRVFRANVENEEYTQITFKPLTQNSLVDTVNIKTLNNKVFYKIQAFDKRYNPSEFSEIITLKKPDVIPPTQPVFKSFKADQGVVQLHWITSSSIDAIKTLVYRKEKGVNTPWQLVTQADYPQDQSTDTTVRPGITYLYTLVTMDQSGLESEPVTPLTITVPDNASKPEIDRFTALVNREEKQVMLNWKYKSADVIEFLMYKSEEGKQPTLYRIFNTTENRFIDKQLSINTTYTYLLQAVFGSRAKSPIKKIEVEY